MASISSILLLVSSSFSCSSCFFFYILAYYSLRCYCSISSVATTLPSSTAFNLTGFFFCFTYLLLVVLVSTSLSFLVTACYFSSVVIIIFKSSCSCSWYFGSGLSSKYNCAASSIGILEFTYLVNIFC